MLSTQAMLRSFASMTAARRSLPDWTHTIGISGHIERTLHVSHASIARNTEERMASNARIISPNTFGIIIISAKTNRSDTYLFASSVQRKTVLSHTQPEQAICAHLTSRRRRSGSSICVLFTTSPNSPAHSMAATASTEKATSVKLTYEPIFGRFMARMALSTRVSGTPYGSNSALVTYPRNRQDAY